MTRARRGLLIVALAWGLPVGAARFAPYRPDFYDALVTEYQRQLQADGRPESAAHPPAAAILLKIKAPRLTGRTDLMTAMVRAYGDLASLGVRRGLLMSNERSHRNSYVADLRRLLRFEDDLPVVLAELLRYARFDLPGTPDAVESAARASIDQIAEALRHRAESPMCAQTERATIGQLLARLAGSIGPRCGEQF